MLAIKIAFLIAGIVIVLSTGCASTTDSGMQQASMPVVPAFGTFGQIFVNDRAIMQLKYDSAADCAASSNDPTQFDNSTKESLSSGKMRLACSQNSVGYLLPFIGTLTNITTNTNYEARFISVESCNALLSIYSKNSPIYAYKC